MENLLLIYGSYGYTGKLIVQKCVENGLSPILAGRNETALRQQAKEQGLEFECFSLNDLSALTNHLERIGPGAVLNCAGPFVETAAAMANACISCGIHYIDITGEFEVIELLAGKSDEARKAGVVLLPGAGFDVVPSDCLARYAYEQLKSAHLLRLHLLFKGSFSAGSAATAVTHFSKGAAVRQKGLIMSKRPAAKTMKTYFGDKVRKTTLIQWGDLSSAYHSTGISNIQVFMSLPGLMRFWLMLSVLVSPLFRLASTRRFFLKRLKKRSADKAGPDAGERAGTEARIVAEVSSINKEYLSVLLITPNAYTLTAETALESARRIMDNKVDPGFQTPSKAFGADFILEFDGVERRILGQKGL